MPVQAVRLQRHPFRGIYESMTEFAASEYYLLCLPLSPIVFAVETLILILSASWCGTSLVVDFEHASRGNQNPKSRLRH